MIQPFGKPAGASAVSVSISGFAFADQITITAGQTVQWTNEDPVPHAVSGDNGSWGSGEIGNGESLSMTFTTPGSFAYHCSIHPAMQGKIIVTARM